MRKVFLLLIVAVGLAFSRGISSAQTEPSQTISAPATEASPAPAMDLPEAALKGDLLAVCVMDFDKGDRTAWTNAWMVMSGGKPTTRPMRPDEPMPLGLDTALGPFFSFGADRFVYGAGFIKGNLDATLCFHLREGVSEDAANKWLHHNFPNSRGFEHENGWLVMSINTKTGSVRGLQGVDIGAPISPQADFVREALNCWGDVPVRVVYLTSDAVKTQLTKGAQPLPAAIAGMAKLYWSAKYVYVGAKLGAHPQVEGRWVAPDEDGAGAVIKEYQASRERLKEPHNGVDIPQAFVSILDLIQPARDGNVVHVSLGEKDLTNIFAAVLVASMNAGNKNNNNGGGQAAVAELSSPTNWTPVDASQDSAAAQMRMILAAIGEYSQAHQAMPASLEDLVSARLLPGEEALHTAQSGKEDAFVYVKPAGASLKEVASPATAGVLFQNKDGKADENGLVGYADGHVGKGK